MRSIFVIIIVFLISNPISAQLWLLDPLEAIYPDSNQLTNYSHKWTCDFPQGVAANVHILVKLPKGEAFTIRAMNAGADLGYHVWSQLIDVPVEQNTGLDSRTEQFSGEINPYVIRRAPFRIFEVIKPMKTQECQNITEYSGFRLSIPPSIINEPGIHKVKILLKSDSFEKEGTFTIIVHPILQPELIESQFFYTNWFNLAKMEEYHHLERWTNPWFSMLDKYAKMMAYGHQNSITIPRELFQFENNEIILNDTLMLRFIDVFRKYDFKYFEAPHLMNRGESDDWGDPELKVALTKKRYYTEGGKKDVEILMKLIRDFAVKNNLTESWLQHVHDEPTAVSAQCYKDVAGQVKEIFPGVKIMEATNDRDGLVGAIDIWCPLINDFQENESFFRKRERKGEKVLVYSCLIPGGKWLNRTLDMERLRQVYFGWGAAFYDTAGYLHWGLNQYHADPFEQSVIKHTSPLAGSNNFLPAGDTHVIYPGEDGPLSSIRFESHRIGAEDYDLLQLLKKQDRRLYKKLINKLFWSYTDYNLSIKDYRNVKKKLLKYLE